MNLTERSKPRERWNNKQSPMSFNSKVLPPIKIKSAVNFNQRVDFQSDYLERKIVYGKTFNVKNLNKKFLKYENESNDQEKNRKSEKALERWGIIRVAIKGILPIKALYTYRKEEGKENQKKADLERATKTLQIANHIGFNLENFKARYTENQSCLRNLLVSQPPSKNKSAPFANLTKNPNKKNGSKEVNATTIFTTNLCLDEKQLNKIFRLVSCISVFKKLDINVRKSLSKELFYNNVSKGRFIIKQGHPSSYFYIILSGSVQVSKQNFLESVVLAILKAGDSFGESALSSEKQRQTTVKTLEDCEFLQIHRDDYKSILEIETKNDLKKKLNFIESNSFFEGMPKEHIQILASSARTIEYRPNEVIFTEGSFLQHVILIWEGTCRVLKTVNFLRVPTELLPLFKTMKDSASESNENYNTTSANLTNLNKSIKVESLNCSANANQISKMGEKVSCALQENEVQMNNLQANYTKIKNKIDCNYETIIKPKFEYISYTLDTMKFNNRDSVKIFEEINIESLKVHPRVKSQSHLIRIFDTSVQDIFGEDSALVTHASKATLRAAFPGLALAENDNQVIMPTLNVSSEISASKGDVSINLSETNLHQAIPVQQIVPLTTSGLSKTFQLIQKAPFSLVANDCKVKCLLLNAEEFSRLMTQEMASKIGRKIQSEGGERAVGLQSIGSSDLKGENKESLLSEVRLGERFKVDNDWSKFKHTVVKDILDKIEQDLHRKSSSSKFHSLPRLSDETHEVKIPLSSTSNCFSKSLPNITITDSNCSDFINENEISVEDFFSNENFGLSGEKYEITPQTAVSSYFNFENTSAAKYSYLNYQHPAYSFDKRRSSVESIASDTTIVSDELDEKSSSKSSPDFNLRRLSCDNSSQGTPKFANITPQLSGLEIPHAAESANSRVWTCFIPDCNKTPYTTGAGLRYHMKHFHKSNMSIRVRPKEKKKKPTSWNCCGKVYSTSAGYRYHINKNHKVEEEIDSSLLRVP
ncbi:Cyclic nucleotide-binding domain-containing protein 2 [Clydaea vesicula]|uniref:Cyclic nucleotide-binding domain-containing protein 2 n=1 Tax=Clydaea vesicula TaxID=447962 RepID=A0AAD5U0J6_9FUNG|nr:Cyclic nucleotide-binding domain-containing protein 2 [Clydaea vesicula]